MILDFRECVRGCAKGLLLSLNGLCILVAVCLISYSAIDAGIVKQYGEDEALGTMLGDTFIIIVAALLIVIACFGCIGAARENVRFLYLYVGFLIILMMTELMLSIYVSLQRYGLEFRVTNWMRDDFFKNVTGDDLVEHKKSWERLQSSYECCGLNGPEDYLALGDQIDMACCPKAHRARTASAQEQLYIACIRNDFYYQRGCEDEILYAVRDGSDTLIGTAALGFCFETAGILLSMWIANNLKHEVKVYKETLRY